jgi:hypothetical protein
LSSNQEKPSLTALDRLGHCPDVATLKPALHTLCEQFGPVQRLDVLAAFHEGTRQAICFLRLDSPEKEQRLMQTLGVGRFGGEIVFVVDLRQAAQEALPVSSFQWPGGHECSEHLSRQSGIAQAMRDFQSPCAPMAPA